MLSDLEVINKMIYAVFIISTALMTAVLSVANRKST